MTKPFLFASIGVLLVGLAMCWGLGELLLRNHPSNVPPAITPARDMRLRTPDDISVAATFTPGRTDRSPAVLLLHCSGASRAQNAANAAWLAGLGYATLTLDFRGHGQSGAAQRSYGLFESRDARTAFDWLKHRQHGAPVAVIGSSLGGAASLIGEQGPLPADALVLQAVYPDIRDAIRNRIAQRLPAPFPTLLEPLLSLQTRLRLGAWPSELSPRSALGRFDGPVLVLGGSQDESTPREESRRMAEAARRGSLWLVPGRDHAAMCTLADRAYRARIRVFLARTMPTP